MGDVEGAGAAPLHRDRRSARALDRLRDHRAAVRHPAAAHDRNRVAVDKRALRRVPLTHHPRHPEQRAAGQAGRRRPALPPARLPTLGRPAIRRPPTLRRQRLRQPTRVGARTAPLPKPDAKPDALRATAGRHRDPGAGEDMREQREQVRAALPRLRTRLSRPQQRIPSTQRRQDQRTALQRPGQNHRLPARAGRSAGRGRDGQGRPIPTPAALTSGVRRRARRVPPARRAVGRGDPRPDHRPAAARVRPGRVGDRRVPRPRPRLLPRLARTPRHLPAAQSDLLARPRRALGGRRRVDRRNREPRMATQLRTRSDVLLDRLPLPPPTHRSAHPSNHRPQPDTRPHRKARVALLRHPPRQPPPQPADHDVPVSRDSATSGRRAAGRH